MHEDEQQRERDAYTEAGLDFPGSERPALEDAERARDLDIAPATTGGLEEDAETSDEAQPEVVDATIATRHLRT